jgi:hypothetical protein
VLPWSRRSQRNRIKGSDDSASDDEVLEEAGILRVGTRRGQIEHLEQLMRGT